MMESYSDSDEECFFDSRDDITSVSDLGSDCNEACTRDGGDECVLGYEFWNKDLESVDERRDRFLKWIGSNSSWDRPDGHEQSDVNRIRNSGDTVLANSDSKDSCFSGRSSQSSQSNEALELEDKDAAEAGLHCKIRNLDNGVEFVVDGFGQDGMLSQVREVGSNRLFSAEEFQRTLGSSPLVQKLLRRVPDGTDTVDAKTKNKRSWLQKLTVATHNKVRSIGDKVKAKDSNLKPGNHSHRVRVHTCSKESKELSSLYTGQEFLAHEGSISTMKFSPCGQYLASAGKDGIVRIWRVIADEIPSNLNVQDSDPSCLYFSLTHMSKLASLNDNREKINGSKIMKKSSESACVVFPPRIFRILEKPLHEFHGHKGEVLALSWSKNGYLLSSSVDKTARLWQVGHDQCLGVYSHNNYVTCVEFNPADDNFFISGSIDGKVRLWEVHGCRVIDWTDVKEIVTAVCYCPDGKGGVVGSMDGNCRFYDVVGNRLQMGSQVCLQGKKKLARKRITGFQYCPNDSSKVMVTSADSQVKILCGSDIICKFKGIRNSGSQFPASFTSDGKHILAVTEDSNVHIWNYTNQGRTTTNKPKHVRSSESFFSNNASVAIPWCGFKTNSGTLPTSVLENGNVNENALPKTSDCFSLGRAFFLDSLSKGTATWPEEKLPNSSPVTVTPSVCKSEYKFLKSAWQGALSSPHLWGLVVVTAGWDGCIRTFLNYGLPIRF
ncbi:PREDICTED: WD repeat-containing protein 44-like [Nicotiana attenuata]|uniref:Compass-like h3k4 histone methylase component wdr5a n=1 Tax=Nicotiana attenuata TaxID=49451 RepID=A0A1J6I4T9_NICAT|nr:PREDICTED: WD repeat-containing protein 44-like [Nicotiana attenuata]OIS99521.1 compass-like h3k4 histone methylase component wdr5a [Nicotiana attenuata]